MSTDGATPPLHPHGLNMPGAGVVLSLQHS